MKMADEAERTLRRRARQRRRAGLVAVADRGYRCGGCANFLRRHPLQLDSETGAFLCFMCTSVRTGHDPVRSALTAAQRKSRARLAESVNDLRAAFEAPHRRHPGEPSRDVAPLPIEPR